LAMKHRLSGAELSIDLANTDKIRRMNGDLFIVICLCYCSFSIHQLFREGLPIDYLGAGS
jgi:hypothetical protein